MIAEAVSPAHPDKIADRIAGALVDYCYKTETNTNGVRCAFEVLIGHGKAFIIGETNINVPYWTVCEIVQGIDPDSDEVRYIEVKQDRHLAKAQEGGVKCGDNGIFYGDVSGSAHSIAKSLCQGLYELWPYDGKLVLDFDKKQATVNWSNVTTEEIIRIVKEHLPQYNIRANTVGDWTGGTRVDTGLTGRKLACDFYGVGAPLGGGNMHGKDLSKADVTLNICSHLAALDAGKPVQAVCSIGDDFVEYIIDGEPQGQIPYQDAVDRAWEYIQERGGFEKFAEWGF